MNDPKKSALTALIADADAGAKEALAKMDKKLEERDAKAKPTKNG